MSLSRSERNSIIINDAKGIQHPLYYVMTDKNGKIQVRKRKIPLTNTSTESKPVERTFSPEAQSPSGCNQRLRAVVNEEQVTEPVEKENVTIYESVTNKKLLEKMLEVLERSTESNDLNKTPVERQKETEENKQFVSNISEQVEKEKIITQSRTPLRRRVRVLH